MARKLEVEIVGDARSLNRALGSAESSTKGLGKHFANIGRTAAYVGGAAGIGALVYGLKVGVTEFTQSAKVAAQTNAVIKSTGGVAKVSAKEVSNLANSLMRKSGVDDEAIASGENMLLTFKNIRNEAGRGNDIFNQSTKVLLDMSTALGQDMPKSAIQLGKALNDPIKGISALQRVGVTFTDGQKKTIKALVDSGHTMEAQKIILRELNSEFGGSAEAMGKTLPGKINILKQEFQNFAGNLVAKTIPAVSDFLGWIEKIAKAPSIKLKLEIIGQGGKDLAMSLKDSFSKALFGWKDAVRAGGPVIDEGTATFSQRFHEGLLAKVNWAELGKQIGVGISSGINITEDAIMRILNFIRAHTQQFADVMAEIAVRMVATLTDPAFWLKHIDLLAILITARFGGALVGRVGEIGARAVGAFFSRFLARDFATLATTIALALDRLPGRVGAIAVRAGTALVNGIVHDLGRLQGQLDKIPGWLQAAFKIGAVVTLIGKVQELYNWLKNLVSKAWNIIIHISIPTPHIPSLPGGLHLQVPHLAAGGIVTKPTLAMIGERGSEAVIPLSKGQGRGAPLQVNLQLDGRTLAALLVDPLRGEIRQLQRAGGRF